MKELGRLIPVEIIDWYDGIVTAVGQISSMPGLFILSLLAWDQTAKRRVYLLAPIGDGELMRVRSPGIEWSAMKQEITRLLRASDSRLRLIKVNEETDTIEQMVPVSVGEVGNLDSFDVEQAISADALKWFRRFNS